MRIRRAIPAVALALLLMYLSTVPASVAVQAAGGKGDEAAIRAVIVAQTAAWNRGDIPAFMTGYEDSPETTFVGATAVNKGFRPIFERYKRGYANKDQMGTLTFKDIDVRLLPSSSGVTEYAVATGHFHLERKTRGAAAKDDGIFSLVWHKGPKGWKILLDHTA